MEASLVFSLYCVGEKQRDFVHLMLSDDPERPLFEEDVAEAERDWFAALEELDGAEWVKTKGKDQLHAGWTIGGWQWEKGLEATLGYLANAGVNEIWGVVAGDDGWYQLFIQKDGEFESYDKWQGKPLEKWFGGNQNKLAVVLDKLRRQ